MSYTWKVIRNLPQFNGPAQEVVAHDSILCRQSSCYTLIESSYLVGYMYRVWEHNDSTIFASDSTRFYKLVAWTEPSLILKDAIQELHLTRDSLQEEARTNWTNYFAHPETVDTPRRQNYLSTENRHQTYIVPVPFVSFKKSAACMADKDLKLTRVAILRCLRELSRSSIRLFDKAVEAWRDYEQALIRYGIQIAIECRQRGFADKSLEKLQTLLTTESWEKPKWIYWNKCRESYQSYLKLQDYQRYIWRILNWFWITNWYIRGNYHSIHQLLHNEWGYNPYNLTYNHLRNIEHRVRKLADARQEFLAPYVSFYPQPIQLNDTVLYSGGI